MKLIKMAQLKLKKIKPLFFVKRPGTNSCFYAVVASPERTTAPKETAHYIMFSCTGCKRWKMKVNTVEWATKLEKQQVEEVKFIDKEVDGKKTKVKEVLTVEREVEVRYVKSATPNWEKITDKDVAAWPGYIHSKFREKFL